VIDQTVIDTDALGNLLEIAGGDDEFVNELIRTYAEDGAAQVERLRVAAAAGDTPALVIGAHSLKTSSLNVGATVVAELSRVLEEGARAGSVTEAPARVEAIASAFDEARAALFALRGLA
jgi:HPt (histidine-containing phosphotransfer) domain-containing protein